MAAKLDDEHITFSFAPSSFSALSSAPGSTTSALLVMLLVEAASSASARAHLDGLPSKASSPPRFFCEGSRGSVILLGKGVVEAKGGEGKIMSDGEIARSTVLVMDAPLGTGTTPRLGLYPDK